MEICKICSEELREGKSYCSACGGKVEEKREVQELKMKHCMDCGAVLDVGKDFCGECGAKVIPVQKNAKTTHSSCGSDTQTTTARNLGSETIKTYKFYRLGYKGRRAFGGMKKYCTIANIMPSALEFVVCRSFTVGGDPVKPQVKEVEFDDIISIHIKKRMSYSWLANGMLCTGLGFVNPLFFIAVALSMFHLFGRKITVNLKYEDPFVIETESTTEADEFVELVIHQLKKR